jgi:hypothetical protein
MDTVTFFVFEWPAELRCSASLKLVRARLRLASFEGRPVSVGSATQCHADASKQHPAEVSEQAGGPGALRPARRFAPLVPVHSDNADCRRFSYAAEASQKRSSPWR